MIDQETNTNRVYNSDRTGYVEFTRNPETGATENFLVTLTLDKDSNKKIILDYSYGKFKEKDFNGKLVKIEPEGVKLSGEEKIEAFKKLGDLIVKEFVPLCVNYVGGRRDNNGSRGLETVIRHPTALLESSANEFLGEEQAKNILVDNYFEFAIKNIVDYSEKNNIDTRNIASEVYSDIVLAMSKSITDKFNDNQGEFVINLLNKDKESTTILTEKIFNIIGKKCGLTSLLSNEEFLKKLTPGQCGKLAAIVSSQEADKKELEPVYKQIAICANKYNESEINGFSKGFAEATNDILFREDKEYIRTDKYGQYAFNIIKRLDNSNKNIFINNIYNEIPNFIDGNGNLSKFAFIEDLNAQITTAQKKKKSEIAKGFKIDKTIKLTPEEVLANRLCGGEIEEDTVQNYFKAFKKHGYEISDIVESTMENIKKREDIYDFVKRALIDNLYLEFKSYKEEKGEDKGSIKKHTYKKEIEKIKKFREDILYKINIDTVIDGNKQISIDINSEERLIDLFFDEKEKYVKQQEKYTQPSVNEEARKRYEPMVTEMKNQLEKSKTIVQNLKQNNSKLFVKSNENGRSIG